ncbi:plant UBX domain-containing protein 4 [Quercus lobata]|uniref:plant UBX domain-containing protein 4 n=1 Tax=Quercus lobata TaxID=97700 RepID=UPI0012493C3F|nr:plant UBX domain-containing protein 4 [Quercus lobata]
MEAEEANPSNTNNEDLITSFCEITSSTREEALFFLESHNFHLDSAVSTFLDNDNDNANGNGNENININPAAAVAHPIIPSDSPSPSPSPSKSPDYSPSRSRSRSPSPTPSRPPYQLRSTRRGPTPNYNDRTRGNVRTLADLNRPAGEDHGSDSDEPQEYYTGGEKSGMLVQDPTKGNEVDAIFNHARQVAVDPDHLQPSSSSKSFTGTARLLSGETLPSEPQHPEVVIHTITFWSNGFSVNDGPLRRFDDPENASFLESIKNSDCPKELEPADRRTSVHVELLRRDENYPEPVKSHVAFHGVGRTLGSSTSTTTPAVSEPTVSATPLNTAPLPLTGLVVDESSPSTSIQLRLADGTRMVSRFNHHHTIREIRNFIDASRPGGVTTYQLLTMGFPPKQLTDLDQTIEQAGIANSVVIQKF